MSDENIPPDDKQAQLREFEHRQREELAAFEEKQRKEFEAFERRESEELKHFEQREERCEVFEIKIDRTVYPVHKPILTGLELRELPTPAIGPDRDLFEVIAGGSDRKIGNDEHVKMRNGLRFFTAPAQINPGGG